MRESLEEWVRDADQMRHLEHFGFREKWPDVARVRTHADDLYVALVGKLFELMSEEDGNLGHEWARLGNAFGHFAMLGMSEIGRDSGVAVDQAKLFSAAAFYCGGYPASAYLALRNSTPGNEAHEEHKACFDLLSRPRRLASQNVPQLLNALSEGHREEVARIIESSRDTERTLLAEGPHRWIPARLLVELLRRFSQSNIRAVLPEGDSDEWHRLVRSFLEREPPVWDYFPSQQQAIAEGLLTSNESFSLQMPTGAGKTTLSETLLYWNAVRTDGSVAVLLVPYRSLASELRGTLVWRLNRMGISSRCAYGGTVPTGDEVRELHDTRVMVATPEALSGLLSADNEFFARVSLVICDEGHLLDSRGRGVALELLLARFRSRISGPPRFVFISAIVPNVEEINAWLGGRPETVVRSDYRPAIAEYAVLTSAGNGAKTVVTLEMHPQEEAPVGYGIEGFLARADFTYENRETGRLNTYKFTTVKTQAVATARKCLPMGATVVFAANKHGNQGAVGLAEEFIDQLNAGIPLPQPKGYSDPEGLTPTQDYLEREYGDEWVGTMMLEAGGIVHHGDIPQETREVLESLLRSGQVRFAVCTNTLAEGVNLPIRTLVLYSVRRQTPEGRPVDLLTRDIKNLVGRAGRAGATTKGLVICANSSQWQLVERVALQNPGEEVRGALWRLVLRLQEVLAKQNVALTNEAMEATPELYELIDGIDATLIGLAAEELGQDRLAELAVEVAGETYAAQKLTEGGRDLLRNVFRLRSSRIDNVRISGRLDWIRDTGTRPRMLDSVEADLLPAMDNWEDVRNPLDRQFVRSILEWAWGYPEIQRAARIAYRLSDQESVENVREPLTRHVIGWLGGLAYIEIAERSGRTVDDALLIHSQIVSYTLQTLVEQGIALLEKFLDAEQRTLATPVKEFPAHLRFGVPTSPARVLAEYGLRHRSAAAALGNDPDVANAFKAESSYLIETAREVLRSERDRWIERLGQLVYDRTLEDVAPRGR